MIRRQPTGSLQPERNFTVHGSARGVAYARGFWSKSIDAINSLIADLVHPTSEVARVIGAVAQGELSKSMALEAEGRALQGEFLRNREDHQHDGRPARHVRRRSHARRT
ncbi:hypothetical protein PCAR4_350219 [Paraburkholderia caribensis]|nr:hypothetical protein PCAR4_350219 [Paraburkholderia caribensis]